MSESTVPWSDNPPPWRTPSRKGIVRGSPSAHYSEKVEAALAMIREELFSAVEKFPEMHSAHEGYAVILEEVDEMWTEVKHGAPDDALTECVQVGAMAVRFLVDVSPDAVAMWMSRK